MKKRIARPTSIATVLLFINIGMFILQAVLDGGSVFTSVYGPFTDALAVHRLDIISAPWTLFTSMFLHANLFHLLVNMWMLFLFGPIVEQRIGSKRFLIVYFLSGFLASLASNLLYDSALGASGALMGILGVTIMLIPDMKVFLFPIPIPITLRTAGIIIALLDISGFLPGVAHAAHLAGLATGLLFGFYLKEKKKKFNKSFYSKTNMDSEDIDEYIRSGRI